MKSLITTGEKKKLEKIAKEKLGIDTLTPRNRDCLDFHDCGVQGILAALTAAYLLGKTEKE